MTLHPFNSRDSLKSGTAYPLWERGRIERRVARLACADWPSRRDLALVEAIIGGGLDRAVLDTGASRDDCLARWSLLFPAHYRGGIDNQAGLVRALREAAAQEVSDA